MYKLLVITCFLLWVVVPVALFKPNDTVSFPTVFAAIYHVYLLCWIFAAAAFLKGRSKSKTSLRLLSIAAGFYFTLTYVLMAYRVYTGHVLDARFAFDSFGDVPTTIFHVLGLFAIIPVLAVAALWFGFIRLIDRVAVLQQWRLKTPPGFVLVLLSIGLFGIFPGSVSYIGQSLSNAIALRHYSEIHPTFETLALLPGKESSENVFFLQLESVNALAAFGHAVVEGKHYEGSYVPRLEEIAKQGILFPFSWGNSIQTARAAEATLCSVSNNVGPPLTFQPQAISTPCLPELLRQAGFSTWFLAGFKDVDFHNTTGFLREKGFDEVLGPQVMAGSNQAHWGYDECEFFQKAFLYLGQQRPNPNRLFVHIAVSKNHFPFEDENRDADRPFMSPANFTERYLNSLAHQDKCLDVFWKQFEDYAGSNSHLFVFGDHSWPVGISGNTFNETGSHVENFAVPVLYIPPRDRRTEFRVGTRSDVKVGQTDLPSTVLEVLGLGTGTNSFAAILKSGKDEKYEECQVVVQPYGDPSIVVIRRSHKYTYHLKSRTLTKSNLGDSLAEGTASVVAQEIPYVRFKREYGCKRYGGSQENW